MIGPINVAKEFNAPPKFIRLEAVSIGPKILIYGLIATCKMAKPIATVNNATKKNALGGFGAGVNVTGVSCAKYGGFDSF